MASYHVRQRDPLLDRNMQAMIERRGKELIGLALIAMAACFTLMLGSYSPEDPGWMVATDAPVQNTLGRIGAAVSSTLTIIGGLGVWGLPVVLAVWGCRLMLHIGEERVLGRLLFAPVLLALTSVFAASHVPGASWTHAFGLGGLFGDTILGALLGVLPVSVALGIKLLSVMLGLGLLALGLFVLGVDRKELRAAGRFLVVGLVVTYAGTLAGLRLAGVALARIGVATLQGAKITASVAATRIDAWRNTHKNRPNTETVRGARGAETPHTQVFQPPHPLGNDNRNGLRHGARYGAHDTQPESTRDTRPGAPPRAVVESANAPSQDQRQAARGLMSLMPSLMKRSEPTTPELVEWHPEDQGAHDEMPSEDRIRARISDVIRARMRGKPAQITPSPSGLRAEPPVLRPRNPTPLIYTPRPPTATGALSALAAGAAAPLAADAADRLAFAVHKARDSGPHAVMPDGAPEGDIARSGAWTDTDWDAATGWDNDGDDTGTYPLSAGNTIDTLSGDADDHDMPFETALHSQADYATRPNVEQRRVVQHVNRRTMIPSRQAQAEAQPILRFDDHAAAYETPPLNLLMSPDTVTRHHLSSEALEENARMLENVLDDYGVKGEIVSVRPGPVVTMYELEPAPGLKASRVIGLADDIARSMSALSARVSTVPGRSVIGIELPNAHREKVVLREILSARDFGDSNLRLPLALGKDIGGDPIVANLAKMPHLLIAGTTGSGKSVAINTMILSLLYKLTPDECRLIMIDPKMLELSVYDGIPHLLSPVVTDPKKAVVALKWVVGEMEERYRKMSKMGVRNIEGFNGRVRETLARGEMFKRTIQTGFDDATGDPVFETEEFAPVTLPYIVVIVDEMADLMMVAGKEIEACIQRLAQMARASGIHLIMATQRPSVDVITGTIKANFPTRISFQVTSKIDSRTILGEQGAEQLLGMGDMLYMAGGAKITRIHGPFVSDEEVEEIVNHLKSFGPPSYMSGVVDGPDEEAASDIDLVLGLATGDGEDALYDQAVAIVAKDRKCSTSYIQRKLGIGYNKAARLVEQMEDQGVVTRANHVGKREILVPET